MATRFIVTIRKVELKTTGGEWKTAYEGSIPLDLVSGEASAPFENKGRAPAGRYVNVRLTLDETIEFAGSDGKARTRKGGEIEIRGTASDLEDLPGQPTAIIEKSPTYTAKDEEAGPVRATVDFDYADHDRTIELFTVRDFEKPFEVKAKSKISVSLTVAKLEEMVTHLFPNYYDGFPVRDEMIFDFPKEFKGFSVRVDDSTTYSTGSVSVKF